VNDTGQLKGPWAGTIAVLLAGSLFATSGVLIKHLVQGYGLQPLTVVAARTTLAALILFGFLRVRDRKLLRLRARDIPFFLLFGFVCMALLQTSWAYAVSLTDVGVAVVLNYTAPAWAALFAWPLLGERINRQKGIALLLTTAGVALMVRIFDVQFLSLNLVGLLWGLASGVLYGLYSIFIRRTLKRYSFWTIITYTFAAGALFLLATQSPSRMVSAFARPGAAFWLVISALVSTLAGHTLFAFGLRFLEATVATILATIEPVMATLWAALFLGESLTWPQVAGGALVIAGVIALQR
jgi:DME family drug/metabolite transporter